MNCVVLCWVVQEAYKMNAVPRGLAVIISNEYFVHLKSREGTDCDVEMLQNLFTELKFEVEGPHKNLSADVSVIFY